MTSNENNKIVLNECDKTPLYYLEKLLELIKEGYGQKDECISNGNDFILIHYYSSLPNGEGELVEYGYFKFKRTKHDIILRRFVDEENNPKIMDKKMSEAKAPRTWEILQKENNVSYSIKYFYKRYHDILREIKNT